MPGEGRLIPPHGGYRKLRSFQTAQLVYDATVVFCGRFVEKRSRTHDQMVQAARSGVQNIAEGSMASATSKKTELKLTGVARARLEELLLDYEDFLRQRGLRTWEKNSPEALGVRRLYQSDGSNGSDASDRSDKFDRRDPYNIAGATAASCSEHTHLPDQPGELSLGAAIAKAGEGIFGEGGLHGAVVSRTAEGAEKALSAFTESVVEDAALDWLQNLGWGMKHGPEIAPGELFAERLDYGQVVLVQRLQDGLARLNPHLPAEAIEDAFRKLTRPEGPTLEGRNRAVHRLLVDGVTVEYRTSEGAIRGAQAQVIDFNDPDNNDWLAVNQFTVSENKQTRRPDVVLFINGLPLALVELKNAADENATIGSAFQQIQTYKPELPTLFAYNALLVVSDGVEARIGTLTAGREWFKPWRTITDLPELQVMIEGVFDKRRLLDLTAHFIVFEDTGGGALAKKMAGYHQFHAVNVAVSETVRASGMINDIQVASGEWGEYHSKAARDAKPGDRRVGVVWHTQGSGKSLTIRTAARGDGRESNGGLHEPTDLRGTLSRDRSSTARWHIDEEDKGAIKVVMTGLASDPLDWQPHIRNKPRHVPQLRLVEVDDGDAGRAAEPSSSRTGAYSQTRGWQEPTASGGVESVASVCACRAARRSAAHPRRCRLLPSGSREPVKARAG